MTDLLAIGTRKGLWLARSDDDRRTWTVDGPHLLAQEVAAVSRRHPSATARGCSPASSTATGARRSCGPTTSAPPGRRPTTAPSASPRTPAPRWPACGSCAPTPPTGPTSSGPAASRTRCGAAPTAAARFELVRGLLRPPAPADLGARRRGRGGAHGAARPGVRPGDDRDEHRRRLRQRGRRREVGAAQQGHHAWSSGPTELPEYGQCVHKVAVDASGPDRLYAQNHFGVFRTDDAGGSWTSIADGLPVDFGFPIVASPHTPGTAWVIPLVADMQRVPPDGRLRVHRTRDAGETWTELGDGAARRRLDGGHARRVLRRRPRARPASTSAPATAASTPAPTRARPSRWSPTTCPTSSPSGRRAAVTVRGACCPASSPTWPAARSTSRSTSAGRDARRPARRPRRTSIRCSTGGSATRPARCGGS